MHAFHLQAGMLTMAGLFYPTGYVFAMFPTEADARAVAHHLDQAGLLTKPPMVLRPEDVLEHVAHTADGADMPLPSAGTEAATVRHYVALARTGHWSVMAYAPEAATTQKVMDIMRMAPVAYAEKYRRLVIEDLA